MEFWRNCLLFGLVVLIIQLLCASALKCVQCFSLFYQPCEEDDVKPTKCEGKFSDANFCVKMVSEYQYGTITWRYCDTKKEKNNTCELLKIRNEDVTVCYFVCDSDGCNTASRTTDFAVTLLTVGIFGWMLTNTLS